MALHARRVKIKVPNESKEIAVIIYTTSIILVLLAVINVPLSTYMYHEVHTTLLSLGRMVIATLFLTLVFIPKVTIVLSRLVINSVYSVDDPFD